MGLDFRICPDSCSEAGADCGRSSRTGGCFMSISETIEKGTGVPMAMGEVVRGYYQKIYLAVNQQIECLKEITKSLCQF